MKLFLDDVREPSECAAYMYQRIGSLNPIYLEDWCIVRTYKEFCDAIANNKNITHVSFDHDLADCFQLKESINVDEWFDINGNREYTGYDCAKYLKEFYQSNNLKMPTMFVHSMNPVGTKKIIELFN